MNITPPEIFNTHIDRWLSEQDQPWLRLRYTLVRALLARHLPDRPLRVLDIGGGSGIESLPLAQQGHTVTLVDYSSEMLAAAQRSADAAGLAGRVTLVQAALDAVPYLFPEPAFDLVLFHNVIQYVGDGAEAVRIAAAPVLPGGVLSLMTSNPLAEPLRLAIQQSDPAGALAQLQNPTHHAHMFETPLQRYTADLLCEWLEASGCAILGHYGVRCVCDYIVDNTPKYDPAFFAALERLELALAEQGLYREIARFIYLIARRG